MTAPARSVRQHHTSTLLSLLELFHPRGHAERKVVIGSGIAGHDLRQTRHALADLIVIAPSLPELEEKRWLELAVIRAEGALSADGLIFVYVPRSVRARARRSVTAAKLVLRCAVLYAPTISRPRLLSSLDGRALRHVLSASNLAHGWRHTTAGVASHLPWLEWILPRILSSVALVAQREQADSPLDWVFRAVGRGARGAAAVVQAGWRLPPRSAVMTCFPGSGSTLIAKVGWDDRRRESLSREAVALGQVAIGARTAGARVPRLLFSGRLNAHGVLLEDAVDGQLASKLLRDHPELCSALLESLASWLQAWSRGTVRAGTVDEEFISAELLQPLSTISGSLPNFGAYERRIRALSESARGEPCPRVGAHNDLTMWNVLRSGSGELGIVDWEAAEEASVPLRDFYYAAVDAVAATAGYRDRVAAARSCFGRGGVYTRLLQPLEYRLVREVAISPAVARLCFHSCWLHHAANESRNATAGDARPFVEIVRWIAEEEATLAISA